MALTTFEWDPINDRENLRKQKVSFSEAQRAFADSKRVIAQDLDHSTREKRYFCPELVERGVLTVRFTYRGGVIRIFGAGSWRKGKAIHDRENQIHR